MISDSALRRGALRGQDALDESGDPLTLIAAKTTVFAYSTTFDDLDLGGEQPRKIGPRLILAQPNLGALSND
jgi:hypothetical protein